MEPLRNQLKVQKISLLVRTDKYEVLVAHPGTQHSYQTALGLQNAGLLKKYVTGFYYKSSVALGKLLRLLPLSLANKLERELLRRRNDELDQNLICTFPLLELSYVIFARLKFTQKWSRPLILWRNRLFDRQVAGMVKKMRPDAVICYDSCARNTFKACKEVGSIAILDQSSAPLNNVLKILREEIRLHPEFADTTLANTPEWLVEQCLEEALAADKVLVASEFVREGLIENGIFPSRIAILRYGVDTARFCPVAKRDDGKFRVLYVGRLSQSKGIQYLLEAFKQLGLSDAELVLVGGIAVDNDALKPYQGIFQHVPHVPHREMPAIFQNADIFVFPSLFEGMGLVTLEAMASGLPVITSQNATSVVRDGVDGFIVPICDIDALKEKIMLMYQDKKLREQMGRQARKRAESFTWQAYHLRLGALVQGFIQESKS
jgi:glycosyltransferase involved in cell wall biosynthesis